MKGSFRQIYLLVFTILLVLSLLPTLLETSNSYSYTSCKEGSVFCSVPGEKTSASSIVKKGRGFPFIAITTESKVMINGKTTVSSTPQASWIAVVIDLLLVGITSLIIALLLILCKRVFDKRGFNFVH